MVADGAAASAPPWSVDGSCGCHDAGGQLLVLSVSVCVSIGSIVCKCCPDVRCVQHVRSQTSVAVSSEVSDQIMSSVQSSIRDGRYVHHGHPNTDAPAASGRVSHPQAPQPLLRHAGWLIRSSAAGIPRNPSVIPCKKLGPGEVYTINKSTNFRSRRAHTSNPVFYPTIVHPVSCSLPHRRYSHRLSIY